MIAWAVEPLSWAARPLAARIWCMSCWRVSRFVISQQPTSTSATHTHFAVFPHAHAQSHRLLSLPPAFLITFRACYFAVMTFDKQAAGEREFANFKQ